MTIAPETRQTLDRMDNLVQNIIAISWMLDERVSGINNLPMAYASQPLVTGESTLAMIS